MIPTKYFITKGVGKHKEQLQSFELALRDASISKYNLVTVSSILPPNCKRITREEGTKILQPGEIIFVVLARNATNEPHRLLASAIGLAIPAAKDHHGYISEHHSFGQTEDVVADYVEDLAASMLASTLGVEFNVNSDWNDREELFKIDGRIVNTTNSTQTALGDKNGLWTSAVSAVVFVP